MVATRATLQPLKAGVARLRGCATPGGDPPHSGEHEHTLATPGALPTLGILPFR